MFVCVCVLGVGVGSGEYWVSYCDNLVEEF